MHRSLKAKPHRNTFSIVRIACQTPSQTLQDTRCMILGVSLDRFLHYFLVRAALFDYTVRGAPSPPYILRRWVRQFRDKSETEIRGLRKTTVEPSGQEAHSAILFRKECHGCNEARKPSCPAPQFNLPRRTAMVRLYNYSAFVIRLNQPQQCKNKQY